MDVYVTNTDEMRTKSMEVFEKVGKLHVKRRNERLYEIWKSAKNRCNGSDYYKKRGIKFCTEWLDYEVFEEWALNNGYEADLSLIRLNKSGNYEPSNCMFSKENKSIKGGNVWTDGVNVRSYNIQNIGSSFRYYINGEDEDGKRVIFQKAGFKTREEAKEASEAVLSEMYTENALKVVK